MSVIDESKFKDYISVDKIRAMPMTLGEYAAMREWDMKGENLKDRNADEEGQLIMPENSQPTWLTTEQFGAFIPLKKATVKWFRKQIK